MSLPAEVLAEIDDAARVAIRGGYRPTAEIIEELVEHVEYDPATSDAFEADRETAVRQVEDAVTRHAQAHAREEADDFPAQTDPDRLTEIFESLDRDGIVARECVGYDSSDIRDEMWALLDQRPDARGFVAFHGQDVERVVDDGVLYLAFAHRSDRDEDFVAIAQEVAERFEAGGFTVVWDGSPSQRIELRDVVWQRRRSS